MNYDSVLILLIIFMILFIIFMIINHYKLYLPYRLRYNLVLDNPNWSYFKVNFNEKEETKLVKVIKDFLLKNISKDTNYIVTSLSGGVDSMVLTYILNELRNKNGYNYKTVCVLLNWNNRKDSIIEEYFIRDWCDKNDMILSHIEN